MSVHVLLGDPSAVYKMPDGWGTGEGAHGSIHRQGREKGSVPSKYSFGRKSKRSNIPGQSPQHREDRTDVALDPRGRNKRDVWTIATEAFSEAHFATMPTKLVEPCILAGCPVGGTVLDPFGGAGTVGLVADRLQRNAILIELNPEYADIAQRRIDGDGGMFCGVSVQRAGRAAE